MPTLKKTLLIVAALAALALGGAALAGAAPGSKSTEEPLRGAVAERATEAALAETGGGQVSESERDDENGAAYEVEVTRADGSQVDVRLDERFEVVAVEQDREDDTERDEDED
jgi:uncharacterized membrane protein YkoI